MLLVHCGHSAASMAPPAVELVHTPRRHRRAVLVQVDRGGEAAVGEVGPAVGDDRSVDEGVASAECVSREAALVTTFARPARPGEQGHQDRPEAAEARAAARCRDQRSARSGHARHRQGSRALRSVDGGAAVAGAARSAGRAAAGVAPPTVSSRLARSRVARARESSGSQQSRRGRQGTFPFATAPRPGRRRSPTCSARPRGAAS